MAKENYIELFGILPNAPFIDDDAQRAMTLIEVIRSLTRPCGDTDKQQRRDHPIIKASDPKVIDDMRNWSPFDIVMVRGVVVSKTVLKKTTCVHCNTLQEQEGNIVYVEPIFVMKISSHPDMVSARTELSTMDEISNMAKLEGYVCSNPQKVSALKKTTLCEYRLAVPRTYRLPNSTVDEKTDYLYINSYGSNAKEDLKRIKTGTCVSVTGYIKAYSFIRESKCECCGQKYEWKDNALNIVPYATEYQRGYVTDKDLGIIHDYDKVSEFANENDTDVEEDETESITQKAV